MFSGVEEVFGVETRLSTNQVNEVQTNKDEDNRTLSDSVFLPSG